MHAMLLHSPSAGTGRPSAEELLEMLRSAGFSPSYCPAKDPGVRERLQEEADLVIAAGGDGTVARVMTQLADRRRPVTILPLGTANNIARALGIAGPPERIIAGLGTAGIRRLDIGSASGPWGRRRFVEAVGFGPLVDAIARIDAAGLHSTHGLLQGPDTLHAVLRDAAPMRVDVLVDGHPLDDDLLLVEVMNIGLGGPRLRLAPDADPGDGQLDVVHLHATQRAEMMAWLRESQRSPSPTQVRRGRQVTIACKGTPVRIDDHVPAGLRQTGIVTVTLEPEPVQVLVPAGDGQTDGG